MYPDEYAMYGWMIAILVIILLIAIIIYVYFFIGMNIVFTDSKYNNNTLLQNYLIAFTVLWVISIFLGGFGYNDIVRVISFIFMIVLFVLIVLIYIESSQIGLGGYFLPALIVWCIGIFFMFLAMAFATGFMVRSYM